MIRMFIGFDQREAVSYYVYSHSIQRRSSKPVSITPLKLSQLDGIMWRPKDPKQSNDFSFSRWAVPFLCNYEGFAIFADTDMLMLTDITELWALCDETKAVQVVKHKYVPKTDKKYLGNEQHKYEKKNWSSFMIFNCGHPDCRKLTQDYINYANGLDLHQFKWVSNEKLIGELDPDWNHLVGEYEPNPYAKNVHYTIIGPWDDGCDIAEYRHDWFREKEHMLNADKTEIFIPNVTVFDNG